MPPISPQPPPTGTPGRPPQRRPPTIAELAQVALDALKTPDGQPEFKPLLRAADRARKAGKAASDASDMEIAFIEYAKAATIILERLPAHRDYQVILTEEQRHNLGLNGQDILDSLSNLKPQLVSVHEKWAAAQPAGAQPDTKPDDLRRKAREREQQAFQQQAQETVDRRRDVDPKRVQADSDRRAEAEQRRQAEGEERARHIEADRLRRQEQPQQAPPTVELDPRTQAALAAARRAAQSIPIPPPPVVIPQFRPPEVHRDSTVEYHQQQAAMQREGSARRRHDNQAGIAQRQKEAEDAERAARSSPAVLQQTQPYTSPAYPRPAPPIQYPSAGTPSSNFPTAQSSAVPYTGVQHPVSHSQAPSTPVRVPVIKNRAALYAPAEEMSALALAMPVESPTRMTHHVRATKRPSFSYPQITTTSPPPDSAIRYPEIMTIHQKNQGYTPSLRSMFQEHQHYPPAPLHVPPPPPLVVHHEPIKTHAESKGKLREVSLPRDSLRKFLSIAALNTARNLETCGLLLGREDDTQTKFIVTCLLVPRQHSTSDTCSMDEEELVMDFTENRGLITIGWIHTHPSQSCFMSSVDLHTHAGFQQMLPESFAVVCAPKSTPNFGIFRLTDPAGLGAILGCQIKEAFHPHPEIPIYTDADRGHVYMTDETIEVVDLR